jgi:pimeloyl-ACP methyl ester carboxylesterase
MTQSIGDSLEALRNASGAGPQPNVFVPTGLTTAAVIQGSPGLADIYVGALQLPYYLTAPASPAQWPLILVDFWKDANGSSPTRYSPVPVAPQDVFVPVVLTVPSPASGRTRPTGGWPTVIFHHGITQNRTNVFAVADMLALRGFAAIAIDLPLHGITDTTSPFYVGAFERTFNVDLINNVTLQPPPDGRIDPSGSHFINPRSAITTRDNLREATGDLFYLMATLPSVDMDGDGRGDLDGDRIGFVGHSLGAIAGTAFVALQDGLSAVTLANPGGGLVRMLLDGSPSFSPLIRAGLAQVGLFPGTPEYETFENAFQQMVDSGDPINYSAAAADAYPIHMIEVVGGTELPDGSISPPDQTVPNTTPNAPLSGTEPMARTMELESVESTVVDATGVRGIVRFNRGNHSTFLSPTRDTPPGTASPAAWAEMQGETADFMAAEGTTLKIVNEAVVRPVQ